MFCPCCGNLVDNNDVFCKYCGYNFATVNERAAYIPSVEDRVKDYIKNFFSSGLFLVAVILLTLSVIFTSVDFAVGVVNKPDVYDEPGMFDKVSVSYTDSVAEYVISEIMELLNAGLLWVVGFWLTFVFAKSKGIMKTGGVSTLKTAAAVERVISFFVAAMIVVDGMLSCISDDGIVAILPVVIFILPLFAGVGFVYVLFCFKAYADVKAIHTISSTGVPTVQISKFVGVFCFITAGLNLMTTDGSWSYVLSSLTEGAACLIFGILFFKFRAAITRFAEEYTIANTPAEAGQTINNNEYMI